MFIKDVEQIEKVQRREELPNLLMLYNASHIKKYEFWICRPWYTADIVET